MADVKCLDDLDIFGGELADDLLELQQDNYHRLITPPGMNLDDPDFGLGLPLMLSGVADGSIGPRIEAELLKDSRNAEVRATVLSTDLGNGRVSLDVAILIETDQGVTTTQGFLFEGGAS
jgi:hypothetical protein